MADGTPILGLSYTSDAGMNRNLDRIDAAFGKLGLTPPEPYVPEEPPPEEPTIPEPPPEEPPA